MWLAWPSQHRVQPLAPSIVILIILVVVVILLFIIVIIFIIVVVIVILNIIIMIMTVSSCRENPICPATKVAGYEMLNRVLSTWSMMMMIMAMMMMMVMMKNVLKGVFSCQTNDQQNCHRHHHNQYIYAMFTINIFMLTFITIKICMLTMMMKVDCFQGEKNTLLMGIMSVKVDTLHRNLFSHQNFQF